MSDENAQVKQLDAAVAVTDHHDGCRTSNTLQMKMMRISNELAIDDAAEIISIHQWRNDSTGKCRNRLPSRLCIFLSP